MMDVKTRVLFKDFDDVVLKFLSMKSDYCAIHQLKVVKATGLISNGDSFN